MVKVTTDAPEESSECLRTADAGLQVLFYLHETFIEDAREVGRGRSAMGNGFPDHCNEGPLSTADPCVGL